MPTQLDQSALRFNQISIITLLVLAFLTDQSWLVALVGAVMLIGTIWPGAGLFKLVYARIVKPFGLMRPDVVADEPQPHLFAQGLGALMLGLAALAFLLQTPFLAWILVGVVVVLAAVNLFFHFCLGCFLYYQLARRGIRIDFPAWRPS